MTKKDYQAVADVLNREWKDQQALQNQGFNDIPARLNMLSQLANELANYFADQNPRFDRERFYDAVRGN